MTAVGGGTIRDMALANGPVFWVKDPTDLVVAMVTSMLTHPAGPPASPAAEMDPARS